MEKDIAKLDLEKNSIPTQKHKTIRQPTPIKKRPSLQKELDEADMEDNKEKSNITINKIDEIKPESSANKNTNKRAQSYPGGFENIPKKYSKKI